MPPPGSLPRRVAIIGGGISGMAAAHRLREIDPAAEITLLEASDRLGGVLQTDRSRAGWLIERSADMFTTREPWAMNLCRRIGIADELVETDQRFRRAYVVRRGRLVPVPDGFTLMSPARLWPIVTTPLLSLRGKLRLAWEYFVAAKKDGADESLESFVVRRFGRQAFDRLVQPLIGGIYTADPAKLSVQATLPQFVEMERKYGSLIRGMRLQQASGRRKPPNRVDPTEISSGARYGLFLAPQSGMQRLVEALAARLPPEVVRLNARVESVRPAGLTEPGSGWIVQIQGESFEPRFDDLILAAPGPVSSRLLTSVDPQLAELIGRVEYAGCSVAMLGIRRDQLAKPLAGFGFVVPAIERRQIIAGSLASMKFPGRAPEGKLLLRIFIGGALQPELATLPDEDIRRIVLAELRELVGLSGEPEFFEVARWPSMMPQYHVGHLDLVRQIEERAATLPNFALCGNAYRGVGIPFCIHSGEAAAESLRGQPNKLV
ncbi:MAG: protoporphyrinogen oxidase [Planctomycetaceae bacterium]|nr:protoporphyrinogen oxidase [Planctomycetaceae bacterium]